MYFIRKNSKVEYPLKIEFGWMHINFGNFSFNTCIYLNIFCDKFDK